MNREQYTGYIDGESLILLNKESGHVYGLEKESAALFLQVDELLSHHAMSDIPSLFPNIPTENLEKILSLIDGSIEENVNIESYEAPLHIDEYVKDKKRRRRYFSGRITFCIKCEIDDLVDGIDAILSHMRCEGLKGKIVNVDIFEKENKVVIQFNGKELSQPVPKDSVPLVLIENMIILHYQSEPYLIAIHAGAVELNGRCAVFPGKSGAGKSTLTAALVSEGFRLYSDEIALVGNDGYISPLPFCVNIKEGSWSILAEKYPDIGKVESFLRFDGQRVKLIHIENVAKKRSPLSVVIFPEFEKGCRLSVEKIGPCETLIRIKDGGYQLSDPLTEENFVKILSYVLTPPAYIVKYGSLKDGIEAVFKLLRNMELNGE